MLQSLRHYHNAKEYIQKALVISTEIGDRKGEADDYGSLGAMFRSLGQYEKAKENLQKALVIRTEIGNKEGEAADLANLGTLFRAVGNYEASEVCLEKALSIKILEIEKESSMSLKVTPFCIYFKIKSKTPFRVFTVH